MVYFRLLYCLYRLQDLLCATCSAKRRRILRADGPAAWLEVHTTAKVAIAAAAAAGLQYYPADTRSVNPIRAVYADAATVAAKTAASGAAAGWSTSSSKTSSAAGVSLSKMQMSSLHEDGAGGEEGEDDEDEEDDGEWRFSCKCGERCSWYENSRYHPSGQWCRCTNPACGVWSHVHCLLGARATPEDVRNREVRQGSTC